MKFIIFVVLIASTISANSPSKTKRVHEKSDCSKFVYGNCPSDCTPTCRSSSGAGCLKCTPDCNGPGSCIEKEEQPKTSKLNELVSPGLSLENYKKKCNTLKDCRVFKGVCGRAWHPVHKRYKDELEKKVQKINSSIDCLHPQLTKPKVKCIDNICQI